MTGKPNTYCLPQKVALKQMMLVSDRLVRPCPPLSAMPGMHPYWSETTIACVKCRMPDSKHGARNWGVVSGSFEAELEQGEIRVRHRHHVHNTFKPKTTKEVVPCRSAHHRDVHHWSQTCKDLRKGWEEASCTIKHLVCVTTGPMQSGPGAEE